MYASLLPRCLARSVGRWVVPLLLLFNDLHIVLDIVLGVSIIHTMKRRNIHFPDVQWSALVKLATKAGVSVSELIRRIIEEYLKGAK